jgi:hypothetical protein
LNLFIIRGTDVQVHTPIPIDLDPSIVTNATGHTVFQRLSELAEDHLVVVATAHIAVCNCAGSVLSLLERNLPDGLGPPVEL